MIMFSIYTSVFNIVKNKYDYETAFKNYNDFADEIVISTIKNNEDSTLEILNNLQKTNNKFKIIISDFDRSDPLFWGKLRNDGLQACSKEFCISLDLDELLPIWQKYSWINHARSLTYSSQDAYLVPLINLWQNKKFIRWDAKTNYLFKWALHKNPNIATKKLKRGPVNFALKTDNTVDITKSDTNELIYEDGELVNSLRIINNHNGNPNEYIQECGLKIFIYHTGYLNFEDRILRNKNFWNEQFKIQAGFNQISSADQFAPVDEKDLLNKNLFEHNLKLWDAQ